MLVQKLNKKCRQSNIFNKRAVQQVNGREAEASMLVYFLTFGELGNDFTLRCPRRSTAYFCSLCYMCKSLRGNLV